MCLSLMYKIGVLMASIVILFLLLARTHPHPPQENRRHARLMKKASRLAVTDLLEIAAMKGVEANDLTQGSSSSTGSCSSASSSGSAAGSGLENAAAGMVCDDICAGEAVPPA